MVETTILLPPLPADGSVANRIYRSWQPKGAKETAELYFDGKIAILDDYKSLFVHGAEKLSYKSSSQDKGLRNELDHFANGIHQGEWPIPWWQQVQVTEMAFAVE